MGRKKNPFLTKISEYKGKGKYWTGRRLFGPLLYGRIYEYRYSCELRLLKENGFVSAFPDRGPTKPYRVLLSDEEVKELGKEKDSWNWLFVDEGKQLVDFTEEEFKCWRRTKIIEHNIEDNRENDS